MRILVVTQYFWPENFKINDICLALKHNGHIVSVLTGRPNYPKGSYFPGYTFFNRSIENFEGILIYRSFVIPRFNSKNIDLIFNYLSFFIFATLRIFFLKGKYDKILVYQPSPVTVGIPALVAKWKFNAKIYFWVQDLWPESIVAAGGIKSKYILHGLNFITKYIYKHCDKILVQSRSFIPYISNQNVPVKKLIYYPNTTEDFYKVLPFNIFKSKLLPIGENLIFAGNIGEAQSITTLIDAALILKKRGINVNWIMLGDGRMQKELKKIVITKDIADIFIFLGAFSAKEMPEFFSCADALIVSLKSDKIFSLTIPSKLQSYMACGKPIIASLDGEGAKIIRESNSGLVAPAENPLALANEVEKFLNLPKEKRISLGENARKYFDKEFSRGILIQKLEYILNLS
jgi:glycosyltransferase involved in cell wall biosynthesis